MSSYPPSPPSGPRPPQEPPPGSGYASGSGYMAGSSYDRRAWKAQQRAAQAQARMMREQARVQRIQFRMQQRRLRRGSIVGPLLLVVLGIILLLEQMGRLSWAHSLEWYARWWPAVLIGAGVILLIEWMIDQQRQDATGLPRGARGLGAGVVLLLIVLAAIGWSARWTESGAAWKDRFLGHDLGGLSHMFGEPHEADASLSYAFPEGATLVVNDPSGAVSVTGTSDDGQVHVNVHKVVYAWRDKDAEAREQQVQPAFSVQGSNLMLDVHGVEQGQADLTIEVPRTAAVAIHTHHGDVRVSDLHAPVTIAARSGKLDLSGIDGTVTAHMNDDDASVTVRSVTGSLTLTGRAGDVTLSNIHGPVMLQGDFFGTTHVEQINGSFRFETSRTRFTVERVDGALDIESDDLRGDRMLGPVTLSSRDRTVELNDVAGFVKVSNRNGAVTVTSASPLGAVEIDNRHGSVDLGLPANSSFVLDAQARNGNVANDFGLPSKNDGSRHQIVGTVRSGGTEIRVAISDGDITIRKTMEPPVPLEPPAPPKISVTPKAPKAPAVATPAK